MPNANSRMGSDNLPPMLIGASQPNKTGYDYMPVLGGGGGGVLGVRTNPIFESFVSLQHFSGIIPGIPG